MFADSNNQSPVAIGVGLSGIQVTEAGLDKLRAFVDGLRRLREEKVKVIKGKTELRHAQNEGQRMSLTMLRVIGDQREADRAAEADRRAEAAEHDQMMVGLVDELIGASRPSSDFPF